MVTSPPPTTSLEAELLRLAGSVPDPELPVLTLEDLGVVRAVHVRSEDSVEVELTPTYTGCPAVETMSLDIERVLREHGIREVSVHTVLTPPWSTDDISPEGRRKLREFGIAPPRPVRPPGPVPLALGPTRTSGTTAPDADTDTPAPGARRTVTRDLDPVRCPHCGSPATEMLSRFSSTACKALRRCLDCREPFDHFKEL